MRRMCARYANEERREPLRLRASRPIARDFDLYFRLLKFPLIPARRLLSRLVYLRCPAQIISVVPPSAPRLTRGARFIVTPGDCGCGCGCGWLCAASRRITLRRTLLPVREIQRARPRPEAASINSCHSCVCARARAHVQTLRTRGMEWRYLSRNEAREGR